MQESWFFQNHAAQSSCVKSRPAEKFQSLWSYIIATRKDITIPAQRPLAQNQRRISG